MLGHEFVIASDCVDETKAERADNNCPTVSHLPSYVSYLCFLSLKLGYNKPRSRTH